MKRLTSIKRAALTAGIIGILSASQATADSVRTIRNDSGGSVREYLVASNIAALTGGTIRIDGWCASACTAYLGAQTTCVTPKARLAFHAPRGGTASQNRAAAKALARQLPVNLQNWYLQSAAHLTGKKHVVLTGSQLVQMGAAHWC